MNTHSGTMSRTNHARRVSRRIKADLKQLRDYFYCMSEGMVEDAAHDIEMALDNRAMINFSFYLFKNGALKRVYKYEVNEDGEIVENMRGGRIGYDSSLLNSEFSIIVTPVNDNWEALKARGVLKLSWGSTEMPSTGHLRSSDDGTYYSGSLGVKRTVFS